MLSCKREVKGAHFCDKLTTRYALPKRREILMNKIPMNKEEALGYSTGYLTGKFGVQTLTHFSSTLFQQLWVGDKTNYKMLESYSLMWECPWGQHRCTPG